MPGTVVPFPESASATISDLVQDADAFKPHCLNLIAAGCGAGKSYFVAKRIASLFPDVARVTFYLLQAAHSRWISRRKSTTEKS